MNALNPANEESEFHNVFEVEVSEAKTEADSDSLKMWKALHEAFDHFNDHLFDSRLDRNKVILSCQRRGRLAGHFWAETWTDGKESTDTKCEISLNPDYMEDRKIEDIFSVLVHEMVHYEQESFGTPGKKTYHNREWANWMLRVGLKPYNVKDRSKETGMRCAHTIEKDGKFAKVMEQMPEHMKLPFLGIRMVLAKVKTGYLRWHCPGKNCTTLARAKSNAKLLCGSCTDDDFTVSLVCPEIGIF